MCAADQVRVGETPTVRGRVRSLQSSRQTGSPREGDSKFRGPEAGNRKVTEEGRAAQREEEQTQGRAQHLQWGAAWLWVEQKEGPRDGGHMTPGEPHNSRD